MAVMGRDDIDPVHIGPRDRFRRRGRREGAVRVGEGLAPFRVPGIDRGDPMPAGGGNIPRDLFSQGACADKGPSEGFTHRVFLPAASNFLNFLFFGPSFYRMVKRKSSGRRREKRG